MSMVHYLTLGHLDPEAIQGGVATAVRPLEEATVGRVIADFPGLKIERKDGYVVVPWHGLGQVAESEEFALRLMQATGCIAADRRNARLVSPAQLKGWARHDASPLAKHR